MPPPRLPKLPSIGQLIEHPRLKHLVSRVNDSALAHRASGFLEEVRATLTQRAGDIEIPTLSSLAERFAHQLLSEAKQNAALINATGLVVGDPTLRPPLPQRALDAALFAATEFHDQTASTAEARLRTVAGAASVFIAHNFESAVQLVLSELTLGGDIGVAQDIQEGDDAPLIDWQSLTAESGVALRSLDQNGPLRLVVRTPEAGLSHDSRTADDGSRHSELESLASLAQQRGAALVDVCPLAGLIDPLKFGLPSVPTIADRFAAGCDAVVIDGSGLLGGPECGVILASEELLRPLLDSRRGVQLRAGPLARIALSATLDLYSAQASPNHEIPVWQLLSAPLENLEQRARRLAPLMAEAESVESAEAIETHSAWCRCGPRELSAPTYMVKLTPQPGRRESLAKNLTHRPAGVAVRLASDRTEVGRPDQGEALFLDLRSVFPRWDQSLVAAVDRS